MVHERSNPSISNSPSDKFGLFHMMLISPLKNISPPPFILDLWHVTKMEMFQTGQAGQRTRQTRG